ncbi:MAG: glycosyltransferase family 4 protein [Desulfomonile tiedjei]|nr:glycosyltransferase family 4 protein [Desulfomonile tiedjei]
MRIALALERFGRHAGGAESYAVELARTLVSHGWEVHMYGHEWDGEPAEAFFHPIARLPKWIPPSIRILHFAFTHRRMIAREHFDIVLGFGNTLAMNVYQSHGGVHRLSNLRKLEAIRNPFLRAVKAMALLATPKYHARAWIESAPFRMQQRPVIIAISDMVRQDMADYFRVDKKTIRLVYNGIDHARFVAPGGPTRDQLRQRLGFGQNEVLFLFMAYDFRKKGVRYLVEAAAKLRHKVGPGSFGVVVVGNHPSPLLSTLVRRLNLDGTVKFPGPTREPEAFYAACDVFILPTFYDACSLVVFEAMAAGLPVISTVFNGASGVLTEGADGAVLKDPRDIDAMAASMERFLDPEFLEAASSAARETASKYTLENNHRQMLDILAEVSAG